jgi:lipopolysaccharide transport system permease protein
MLETLPSESSTLESAEPINSPRKLPKATPDVPWMEIRPATTWQLLNVRECWHYRDLLLLLVRRDVQVRYRQAVLGAAWAVLQPALMMVIFNVYFGKMVKAPTSGVPYPVFVYTGLLPWSFFASAVVTAANSIISSERLISKIYIPRLLIPLAAIGAAVVDFLIAMLLLAGLMIAYHVPPGRWIFLFPAVFLVIAIAAMGVGSMLAALNVSYRDFRYVVPFVLQLWLFATPTIYMESSHDGVHGLLQHVLQFNPLTGSIAACRAVVLGTPIDWSSFGDACASTAVCFIVGILYFRRTEDRFADVI